MPGYSSNDLRDIYGSEYFESAGYGAGVSLGAGVGFALASRFSLLAVYEPIIVRRHLVVYPGDYEDRWRLDGAALLAGMRWLIHSSDSIDLFLGAMAGRYSLSGAGVTYSYVPGEMVLGGSAPGGVVELGGSVPLSGRLSLAGALGYRVARISPVRRSGTVGRVVLEPADLLNADGSRASVDLSGFSLTLALAFAFGPR